MNRRTFNKYLLAAPIALIALLLRRPTPSVVREKEKDEGLPFIPNNAQKQFGMKEEMLIHFDSRLIAWPYTSKNLKYI